MRKVAAIILAAGEASRFGKPKLFLEFEGKTLLRRIVDASSEANCSPIIIVTGGNEVQVQRETMSSKTVVVRNENWKRGLGTSIRSGVAELTHNFTDVGAAILLVCDQPFVDGAIIKQLISLSVKTGKSIVASSYADTLGVPAIFDRSCFSELLRLDDASGAKPVILSNRGRVAKLPFPEGKIDIDTAEDWVRLNL